MSIFQLRLFNELTDKQKIAALVEMVDFYKKDNNFIDKVDSEWIFEVLSPDYEYYEKHKNKCIAFNKAIVELMRNLKG